MIRRSFYVGNPQVPFKHRRLISSRWDIRSPGLAVSQMAGTHATFACLKTGRDGDESQRVHSSCDGQSIVFHIEGLWVYNLGLDGDIYLIKD